MTGTELETFCEEINGGASIGPTLLFQFINLAKAMVEQTRPWMLLRYTDTSVSVAAGTTWQTAIDLSAIARFNRFYGDTPLKLFDGANGIEHFRQVPFDKRLEYRSSPGTFVYDEASKTLYRKEEYGHERDSDLVALCRSDHEEYHERYGTQGNMVDTTHAFIDERRQALQMAELLARI